MSESKEDKLKKIIEAKKKSGNKQHIIPTKKVGATHVAMGNQKTGGSNNKV